MVVPASDTHLPRPADAPGCRRCGICCIKGGPVLHGEDRWLVKSGLLPPAALVTIRIGELVHQPLTDTVVPTTHEMLKISGVKGGWQCRFYRADEGGCTIYEHRPSACRAMKCWDITEISALMGTDLLTRFELIEKTHPMYGYVQEHEQRFPCPDLIDLQSRGISSHRQALEKLINDELGFRGEIIAQHKLSLGEELFYFGRPLFHLLSGIGINLREIDNRLVINS
jgi:hypothetical protein